MAGKTFLDELAILNSQNFMGGLATMGEAIKEEQQNKTLVQLFNEFQVKKEGLSTTGEQLSDFNKMRNSRVSDTDSLSGKNLSEDEKATVNLFGYLQKQEALLGTYEPFIQAFSVLGEDGVKVAKTLTDELSRKLTLEESKGQIPFKQLEYDKMKFDLKFDEQKFNDYMDLRQKNKEVAEIEDFITNNELYRGLPDPEKVYSGTKYGDSLVQKYNVTKDVITKQIREKYPNLSEGVLTQAVNYTFSLKQHKIEQIDPTEYLKYKSMNDQIGAFKKQQIEGSINTIRWISQEWRNYPPEIKNLFREWVKNPAILDDEQRKAYESRFDNLHKALMPGGQYDYANGIIYSTFGDGWYSTQKVKKGGTDVSVTKQGDFQFGTKNELEVGGYDIMKPTLNIPGYNTEELIRARSGIDIINGVSDYDPSVEDNINIQMQAEKEKRLIGSWLQERKDKLSGDPVNRIFDAIPHIPHGRR